MKESQALLRLQDIDLQLMRIDAKLKSMPQQKRLRALEAAKRKLQGQLLTIVGQRKDAEMEVSDLEARHADLTQQADEVKGEASEREASYRHINDLEAQLTSIAKKTEKCEYEHGKAVAELDRLKKAEKNARDVDARLDDEKGKLEESYKKDSADLMAQVRTLAGERKTVLADISDENKAAYEKASKRFGGLAVERLRGNVPSICNVKLQPSAFATLRDEGPIAECPYCHRMLVVDGALDPQQDE